jgi:hypothetical protein
MASKAPPVPPDQRSGKIRGAHAPADTAAEVKRDPAGGDRGLNLKEQGRYGSIHQNLTHQGRQQDR